MQNARKALLVEGPIGPTLVKLTLPMILGIIGIVVFNLVDTYYVGQLGTNELAAISFTFPVVFILGSLSLGLGVGTSAVVSRAIGEGDHGKVQRFTTDSLTLAVVIVTFFAVIGLFTIDPIFTLMGAPPDILPLIREYMVIWYFGMPFIVIPMVGNNAIRATGDTKTPSIVMLVAAGVNIVLDPIFIFGLGPVPRMELAGAAIATVLARAITFIVALWILYYRENMITFKIPAFKEGVASWGQILYIGVPAAGTNMIVPLGTGIVTAMLAGYGPEAVAGFGVASRIEVFALTVVMALGSVLAPFVGQNLGAGKQERLQTGIRLSQSFAMGWGVFVLAVFLLFARPLAGFFNDDPRVIQTITTFLWIVPVSYGFQGVLMLSSSALNVLNKPFHAAALNILRIFVIYIPVALLASSMFGAAGIFGALAFANVVAGIAAFVLLRRVTMFAVAEAVARRANAEAASPLASDKAMQPSRP
jgi:putative MATE family efflux protein